jgi:hypothetical protein
LSVIKANDNKGFGNFQPEKCPLSYKYYEKNCDFELA